MDHQVGGISIDAFRTVLARQKAFGEHCVGQLDDQQLQARPLPGANSVAVIMRHIAGSMRSRFTDFPATDGEKPDRDRESEFDAPPARRALIEQWDASWRILFDVLAGLSDADLARTVTIRGEPHTVAHALCRALDHYGYHVGQIAMLSRAQVGDAWRWFTIPPGQSQRFTADMRRKFENR